MAISRVSAANNDGIRHMNHNRLGCHIPLSDEMVYVLGLLSEEELFPCQILTGNLRIIITKTTM